MVIAAAPPAMGGPTREYRAATAFVIAAVFMLVVLLLVIGAIPISRPPVQWAVTLVGPIVLMLILFATAFGLAQRAEWASAAMAPLLYLLLVTGLFSSVMALTRSTFEIPIGAILAIWALRAPPSRATGSIGALAPLIVAVAVAAGLWALPTEALLRPGGPFIAEQSALQPSIGVTCAPPLGAEPARIDVRYDWQWLRAEPWPGGQDTIQLVVYPVGEDNLLGFAIDDTNPTPVGIWQSDMMIFSPIGITYGIEVATTRFEPRSVGFGLIGPPGSFGTAAVEVRAIYTHGPASTSDTAGPALWSVETTAECAW